MEIFNHAEAEELAQDAKGLVDELGYLCADCALLPTSRAQAPPTNVPLLKRQERNRTETERTTELRTNETEALEETEAPEGVPFCRMERINAILSHARSCPSPCHGMSTCDLFIILCNSSVHHSVYQLRV